MSFKIFFKKPYLTGFLLVFILYLAFSVILSGFYNTISLIVKYASTVNWFKLGLSLLLTLIIGFFVAANSVLVYHKWRERRHCREGTVLAGAGTVGGLIVGVCPLCLTGLIPLLLGFFGVSFSFASLPFQGIEIQVIVIVLLAWSYYLIKDG